MPLQYSWANYKRQPISTLKPQIHGTWRSLPIELLMLFTVLLSFLRRHEEEMRVWRNIIISNDTGAWGRKCWKKENNNTLRMCRTRARGLKIAKPIYLHRSIHAYVWRMKAEVWTIFSDFFPFPGFLIQRRLLFFEHHYPFSCFFVVVVLQPTVFTVGLVSASRSVIL